MTYVDGVVIAVPKQQKQAFLEHADSVDRLFIEWGALRVMECWGDDVPAGKQTDFYRAVQAKDDEAVVFSWIEWPDKATRDLGMQQMHKMEDPRLTNAQMPFDGMRMIYGGFETIYELANRVHTCLWFNGRGEEAAEFYTSLIPGSAVTQCYRPKKDAPALTINFTLAGTPYQILDAGPAFPQTEAASIVVQTEDQAQTDHLWNSLIADGGKESQCGWLKDRYGVSWQIVPKQLLELLANPAVADMVTEAMFTMKKLDISALQTAATSKGAQ